jgi:hypothetical protein
MEKVVEPFRKESSMTQKKFCGILSLPAFVSKEKKRELKPEFAFPLGHSFLCRFNEGIRLNLTKSVK